VHGLYALFRLVLARAIAMPGVLAVRVIGTLLAVTLVAGVSLYSGAMGDAMLQTYLAHDLYNTSYIGTSYIALGDTLKPLSPPAYAALDTFIRHDQGADIGLPLDQLYVRHFTTMAPVYHAIGPRGVPNGPVAGNLPLEYYDNLAQQVVTTAGTVQPMTSDDRMGVAIVISQETARALHAALGDQFVVSLNGHQALTPPLVIRGIFRRKDKGSDFWAINSAQPFMQSLIVSRAGDFVRIAAASTVFSPSYFWRYRTPLGAIHLDSADMLLNNLQRARSKVSTIAQGTEIHTWLDQEINGFQYNYGQLPVILYVLVAPIVLLVLYAITVTTALVLDRQGGEIVLMRSRGATRRQVLAIYILEGGLIGLLAIACGLLLGLPLARLIGATSGFVHFGTGLPVTLRVSPTTILSAVLTAVVGVLVGLGPALGLTRRLMTAYKAEGARANRKPLWQHLYVDLVVLALALYGYSVLHRQGPVSAGAGTAAIAQDPLIGIAPLGFAIAVTLMFSRLLPWLATVSAYLTDRLSSPALRVALQSIARVPRQPMRLVQLLTLTLTMGVFAATVAGVEQSNLADQQRYDAGSTVRLSECRIGIVAGKSVPLTMPVAWHRTLPGARAVSPVLRLEAQDPCSVSSSAAASDNTTDNGTSVSVLGIDPASATNTMWFRSDFAPVPLQTLLGGLVTPGPNALVSRTFLQKTGLHTGDTFTVNLTTNTTLHAVVAAAADYFPTLDPTDQGKPFVVVNLPYLVKASGRFGPNEMWIRTDDNRNVVANLIAAAHARPSSLWKILDYQGIVPPFSASDNPLQAGIYGIVSVGFLIAIGLSLLGFFAYAYLSLQRRLTEFAIVRALGLSPGGLRWLLLSEQFFLLGTGILGGIAAGVLTTVLFLPYLPIAQNTLPPYLVVIPWTAVEAFAGAVLVVFILVLSAHAWMVLRVSLGRVLRLGEA